MKFENQSWTINQLMEALEANQIELKPPYQRNFIWSPTEQQDLIESINKNYPLPTFFVYQRKDGIYDMVDGQQRTRTIYRFINKVIKDKNKTIYEDKVFPDFKNYIISVTIILELNKDDSLEIFYARVNKTGKRLNFAELHKAEYYETNFLKLVEELTESQVLKNLNLFRDITIVRMNDRDFVEEIVTLIYLKSFTDKKLSRDKLYEKDITKEETNEIKKIFFNILEKIKILDEIQPINKTRFRQKNDFFTLFSLIYFHPEVDLVTLKYLYQILQIIGREISPSNEKSEYLREYAINCVSQSNSKNARERRYQILESIILNPKEQASIPQLDIISYYENVYGIKEMPMLKIGDYFTFDLSFLKKIE